MAYLLKPDTVDLYAITGTNGKTTTVSLLQAILAADGRMALAGGNIGVPLTTLVDTMTEGVVVVEASSFQLETTCHLIHISALLNITLTTWIGTKTWRVIFRLNPEYLPARAGMTMLY